VPIAPQLSPRDMAGDCPRPWPERTWPGCGECVSVAPHGGNAGHAGPVRPPEAPASTLVADRGGDGFPAGRLAAHELLLELRHVGEELGLLALEPGLEVDELGAALLDALFAYLHVRLERRLAP